MSSSQAESKRVSLPGFEEMLRGGSFTPLFVPDLVDDAEEEEEEAAQAPDGMDAENAAEEGDAEGGEEAGAETRGARISLPSFEDMMRAAKREIPVYEAPEEERDGAEAEAEAEQEEGPGDILERARAEAETERARIQAEAGEEAARIIAEAKAEANAIRTRVEEDTAGAIERRYQDEMRTLRASVLQATEGLNREREGLFSAMEGKLIDLCVELASSIVHYELDKDEKAYLSMIQNALDKLQGESAMALHMPPVAYERIFGGRGNNLLAQMKDRQVSVVKDLNVKEGDCLVQSDRGGLRVGAHTQTTRLREAVLQQWGEVKR